MCPLWGLCIARQPSCCDPESIWCTCCRGGWDNGWCRRSLCCCVSRCSSRGWSELSLRRTSWNSPCAPGCPSHSRISRSDRPPSRRSECRRSARSRCCLCGRSSRGIPWPPWSSSPRGQRASWWWTARSPFRAVPLTSPLPQFLSLSLRYGPAEGSGALASAPLLFTSRERKNPRGVQEVRISEVLWLDRQPVTLQPLRSSFPRCLDIALSTQLFYFDLTKGPLKRLLSFLRTDAVAGLPHTTRTNSANCLEKWMTNYREHILKIL